MPSLWSATADEPVSTVCGSATLPASSVMAGASRIAHPSRLASLAPQDDEVACGGQQATSHLAPRHPEEPAEGGRLEGWAAETGAIHSSVSPCCHLRRCRPNQEMRMAA